MIRNAVSYLAIRINIAYPMCPAAPVTATRSGGSRSDDVVDSERSISVRRDATRVAAETNERNMLSKMNDRVEVLGKLRTMGLGC